MTSIYDRFAHEQQVVVCASHWLAERAKKLIEEALTSEALFHDPQSMCMS